MTRDETVFILKRENNAITVHISEITAAVNRLTRERDTLTAKHLDNTNEINRLLSNILEEAQ